MLIANASVVTGDEVLEGAGVEVRDGRIARVVPSCTSGDVDLGGRYLLPGLVDIHVHQDLADLADAESLASLCAALKRTGTAAFLISTSSVPIGELLETLGGIRKVLDALRPDCGCAGFYLEAPYVAFETKGGFDAAAITSPEDLPVADLLDACGDWTRYLNISPELPGAIEAIRECAARGVAVSMGHSAASKEVLEAALDAGVNSVCHMFNTGTIMRYKEPGVLDVTVDLIGLSSDRLVAQLICDGTHVDPVLVRLMRQAKGREGVALITDSLTGGRRAEEGQRITKHINVYTVTKGVGRLPDGGLAGSTLSMATAVRNYVEFTGCSLQEAVRAASAVPARVVGLDEDYGVIAPGRRAQFCVLDEHLAVCEDLCAQLNLGEEIQ